MKLTLRHQTIHLLPQKAAYWEEQKTLIIADIHIGKGSLFRKAGIPIPSGIMEDDLLNMTNLIDRTQARKCIIVGDLIHAPKGLTHAVISQFAAWLQNTPCEIHLIFGNHDRALIKNLPPEWDLHTHKDALLLEPFYFSHHPLRHETFFVFSGHIHPKIEISNKHDRLVLRCFQIFKDQAILPAFGFFTGGVLVKKSKVCKVYAIADDTVVEV
jgi:DNA ligase-associated metallophosphoesterase